MGSVQVVTGYVPIPNHPRSAAEYGKLGEQIFIPLVTAGVNVKRYMAPLQDCWLHKYLSRYKHNPPLPSVGDNPAKNTLAYHIVQHQKFGWLLKAAIDDPRPDHYVWLDYGIGHVPGVDPIVIGDFLDKVIATTDDNVHIPGCWPQPETIDMRHPCWRFCGGVMIVPRRRVHRLYKTIKTAALRHIDLTKNVEWEVNTLARAEQMNQLPIRWYQADHNETMFTGYEWSSS